MRPPAAGLAGLLALWGSACLPMLAPGATHAAASTGTVAAIEVVSAHPLPEDLVRQAIGDLAGRPLSRLAVRQSLERLWALGLFSDVRVEEVPDAGGLRLRYTVVRRPFIRRIVWEGPPGLSLVDLVEAAGLAVGGDVGPERLEAARKELRAAYAKEGYFAARVTITAQPDPATNASDVTVALDPGEPARIGAIRFEGVAGAEAERLGTILGVDPGDRFREATLRERARALEERLRRDGHFEARVDVEATTWQAAGNTVSATLEVSQGPRYQVEFRGVEAVRESRLRERLPFPESGVVDEAEIAAAARRVEAAYREEGYHFVRVSGALEPRGEGPVIVVAVTEGPRVRVESVEFFGTEAFPAARLQELIQTRTPALLRKGLFRQDVLDRDLLVLVGFYRSQGFPDAQAGPARAEFSEDRERARITIPIVEGPRVRVGAISIEGAAAVSAADLRAAIPLRPGTPWTVSQQAEARRVVERVYARRGYLGAGVSAEATRRADRVDVTIRVVEGLQTRVGRILIQGLTSTQEAVVRREFTFRSKDPLDPEEAAGRELSVHAGEPLNPEALVELEKRLSRLGIFERVRVGPLRPPSVPYVDVEIVLREGKPWRLDLGGGYGTDRGWRGFIEVGHDNLLGTGQSASLREEVTEDGDRTDLTYRSPWLFDTPWQGDVTLFRERWREIGYFREGVGGAVGIRRELFADRITGLRGGLRYQVEWTRLSEVDASLAAADIVPGDQVIAKITPALTLDRRDDILDPARGGLHSVSLDLAGAALGSDADFVKAQLATAWYLDLLPPTVIAVAGRLGLAGPIAGSAALPVQERFFAGGATTIRGYPKDRVGPTDASGNPTGGNFQFILNAEWRVPIWRWLSAAAFLDTGTVAPELGDLGSAKIRTGVGAGIRLKTPVGPVRFDAGYALNPIQGEDRWQLYLSVGHPF